MCLVPHVSRLGLLEAQGYGLAPYMPWEAIPVSLPDPLALQDVRHQSEWSLTSPRSKKLIVHSVCGRPPKCSPTCTYLERSVSSVAISLPTSFSKRPVVLGTGMRSVAHMIYDGCPSRHDPGGCTSVLRPQVGALQSRVDDPCLYVVRTLGRLSLG